MKTKNEKKKEKKNIETVRVTCRYNEIKERKIGLFVLCIWMNIRTLKRVISSSNYRSNINVSWVKRRSKLSTSAFHFLNRGYLLHKSVPKLSVSKKKNNRLLPFPRQGRDRTFFRDSLRWHCSSFVSIRLPFSSFKPRSYMHQTR